MAGTGQQEWVTGELESGAGGTHTPRKAPAGAGLSLSAVCTPSPLRPYFLKGLPLSVDAHPSVYDAAVKVFSLAWKMVLEQPVSSLPQGPCSSGTLEPGHGVGVPSPHHPSAPPRPAPPLPRPHCHGTGQ